MHQDEIGFDLTETSGFQTLSIVRVVRGFVPGGAALFVFVNGDW